MIVHYYERNIGDYHRKAGRLNILQHGVYNLLIDACYDRERFPASVDEAVDWVWAESDEEIKAVEFVLKKFFKLNEEGFYVQNHIKEDLEAYKGFINKQTENGKKGGRPKGSKNKASLGNDEVYLGNSGLDDESQENPPETQINPNKPNESLNHRTTEPINQEPETNLGSSSLGEEVEVKFTDLGFEGLPDQYRDLALTEYPNLKTSTLTGIWQRFAKYYRDKPQVLKNDQGWLSLWAESLERYAQAEIDKATAPKPSRPAKSNYTTPQRQSDTTRPSREQTFDQFTDDMVYSNNLTAGFIRQNRLEGEELDFCVARLVRERFEQEAQQRKQEHEAREAAKRQEQQRKQQLIDEFEAKQTKAGESCE